MDLLLRAEFPTSSIDVACVMDDLSSVGELADYLALEGIGFSVANPTLHRLSRGELHLHPETPLSNADLRTGDRVRVVAHDGSSLRANTSRMARMIVVRGPDAGAVFELAQGANTIGRSNKCDVAINDPQVSRQHAIVRVSDEITVSDQGSINATEVNGLPVVGSQRVRPGDHVLFGTSVVRFEHSGMQAPRTASPHKVSFNRPPRIYKPFTGGELKLPAPLERPGTQRLPMISAGAPLILGIVLYLITRNVATVLFVAFSPILILGSWYEGRRSGRHDYGERVTEHEDDLHEVLVEMTDLLNAEVSQLYADSPGPQELEAIVRELDPRLWERSHGKALFLDVRVGVAPVASSSRLTLASGGSREDRARLMEYPARYATLPDVPALLHLGRNGGAGVSGPPGRVYGLARSAIVQAAVLHSPAQLVICALMGEDQLPELDWLKWLPQTRATTSPITGRHLADSPDSCLGLLAELNVLIAERIEALHQAGSGSSVPVSVLVVVDDSAPVERPRLNQLLENGPQVGVFPFWITDDPSRLPSTIGASLVVAQDGSSASLADAVRGERLPGIRTEELSVPEAEGIARHLSPVIDVSSGASDDSSLPRTVSLVDLLGGVGILEDSLGIKERWDESAESRGLRGPVGATASGTLSLDLRHDGPHGLVGGTTGAGKSEFLRALIVGLAATLSPERISFLLVDYKGGSAFKECTALPHTVGMITDLTPNLVARALTSLRAELHRRERLLNKANAKDLIQMEADRHPETPPSLVIVIDEFAALAREVPEFVDGVVDIAQRGRGVGMHLLLATHRPAGMATPNIKANTNLRVALRMASDDESIDIVDSPAAGQIDRRTPGRGLARLGSPELIRFQSAYVGGVTAVEEAKSRLKVGTFGFGTVEWRKRPSAGPSRRPDAESDLTRLVAIINRATLEEGIPRPTRPWLRPLPSTVDLLSLPRPATDAEIVFGLVDDPAHQTRLVAAFRPDQEGGMLFYGTGGSGKTVALRSLAAAAGLCRDRSRVTVHALDFAGRGLDLLDVLPHVGSVIPGDDYEMVTRLLADIKEIIESRSRSFAAARASSLSEYRRAADCDEIRWFVLLDGFDNFMAAYERTDRGAWAELLPRLVADGRQVGVHFIMTGTRRGTFPMALTSAVQKRCVFRMASEEDYHALNVDPKVFDRDSPPGRFQLAEYGAQAAIVGGDSPTAIEALALRHLGEAQSAHGGYVAEARS